MDSSLIDGLANSPAGKAVHAEELADLNERMHCDLSLKTVHGYAFFRIIDPREDVVERWRETQDAIASYLYQLSSQGPLPNAYLTLLVEGTKDVVSLQRIERNAYVCRKLVIPWRESLTQAELIARLPFLGLPAEFDKVIQPPIADPLRSVDGTRLHPRFAEDLLQNTVSVTAIVDQIDDYQVDGVQVRTPASVGGSSINDHPDRLVIRELKLDKFRNFGRGQTIKLGGDLVVIFGRNGAGKTSLVEGIEWALTGESSRVEQDSKRGHVDHRVLANWDHGRQQPTVTVQLSNSNQSFRYERTLDLKTGDSKARQLRQPRSRGIQNRDLILSLTSNPIESEKINIADLRPAFQSFHFLAQHTLEAFLSQAAVQFGAIARMAGAERLGPIVTKGERVYMELKRRVDSAQEILQEWTSELETAKERQRNLRVALMEQIISRGRLHSASELLMDIRERAQVLGWSAESLTESSEEEAKRGVLTALLEAIPRKREFFAGRVARAERLLRETDEILKRYARQQEVVAEQARSRGEKEKLQALVMDLSGKLEQLVNEKALLQTTLQAYDFRQEWETQKASLNARKAATAQTLEEQTSATNDAVAIQAGLLVALADVQSQLQEAGERLVRNQQVTVAISARQKSTRYAVSKLSQWHGALREAVRLREQIEAFRSESQSATLRREEVLKTRMDESEALSRLKSELAEAERLSEERQALIVALQRHVHESDTQCPFCHYPYGTPAELQDGLQRASSLISSTLVLAKRALSSSQARVLKLNVAIEGITARLKEIELQVGSMEAQLSEFVDLIAEGEQASTDLVGTALVEAKVEALEKLSAQLEERENNARGELVRVEREIAQLKIEEATKTIALEQQGRRLSQSRQSEAEARSLLAELDGEERILAESEPTPLDVIQFSSRGLAETRLHTIQRDISNLTAILANNQSALDMVGHQDQSLVTGLMSLELQLGQTERELAEINVSAPEGIGLAEQLKHSLVDSNSLMDNLGQLESRIQAAIVHFEITELGRQVESEVVQENAIEAKVKNQSGKVSRLEQQLQNVQQVIDQAQTMRQSQVQSYLDEFLPVIRILYKRLSPHPYFGDLDIRAVGNSLQIRFELDQESKEMAPVLGYFSQAQRVAVALCIFLSSTLLQGWTRLGTICLDDPVQHMDDMNVFAFLDLLQGIVQTGRQIIVTTASEELYRVFLARFSHWNDDREKPRFQALRLEGIRSQGPDIEEDTRLVISGD